MKKEETTSVQVCIKTTDRLATFKQRKEGRLKRGGKRAETYEEVINRALDSLEWIEENKTLPPIEPPVMPKDDPTENDLKALNELIRAERVTPTPEERAAYQDSLKSPQNEPQEGNKNEKRF